MPELRMQSPLGPRVVFSGQEYDYFAGTGYLGLQNHPAVLQAAVDTIQRYGLSTGTSRGGYGEHPVYDELEAEACAFFGGERMLYYASGYLGTILLLQGLSDQYDRIFIDSWSHFSVWDGARSSGKPLVGFEHLQPAALENVLRQHLAPGERPLILSDGVFPISGEIAPACDYLHILNAYPGGLMVLDDAHAGGVLGPNGLGTLDHSGIHDPRCYAAYTLSKALGSYGGLLVNSTERIDALDRNSRVYGAASPPPLPIAAAAARALHIARTEPARREQLWQNVARARAGFRTIGWALEDSPSPILCLRTRPDADLETLKQGLFARGICVAHVRSYSSTPPGGALRIAIFATHTAEQIDNLITSLASLL